MKYISAFGAATNQGDWPVQEDAFYADPRRGIFILTDGFGGRNAGDRIAKELTEQAADLLIDARTDSDATKHFSVKPCYSDGENVVLNMLVSLNSYLFNKNQGLPVGSRACASMTVLFGVGDGSWAIGNVGTNALYLFRQNACREVATRQSLSSIKGDHAGVQQPYFDTALQAIGLQKAIEPFVSTFSGRTEDVLLACSAGVIAGQAQNLQTATKLVHSPERVPGISLESLVNQILDDTSSQDIFASNRTLVMVEPYFK